MAKDRDSSKASHAAPDKEKKKKKRSDEDGVRKPSSDKKEKKEKKAKREALAEKALNGIRAAPAPAPAEAKSDDEEEVASSRPPSASWAKSASPRHSGLAPESTFFSTTSVKKVDPGSSPG